MAACNTRPRLSEMSPDAVEYFMEKLLFNIYNCFDEQEHIDVTFKLANPNALVTAHRVILTSASPYFRDLFRSEKGLCPVIEINDIDSDTFEHLITFCYTGKTFLTTDNVENILKAALILQLDDAAAKCADFVIENISDYTLQRAYALERENQCAALTQTLLEYENDNFMTVVQSDEFLKFDANKLHKILECNTLNVPREKDLFEIVKRWYEHDPSGRKDQVPDLVSCLRLTQFDTRFLLTEVQILPGCESIVLKALSWINCPQLRSNLTLKYTEKRGSQTVTNEQLFALHLGSSEDKIIFQYVKSEASWQKWLALKINVSGFQVIFMDENLIFIGGTRNNQVNISEVTSWNCKTKTFKQLPSMNQPRQSHSLAILNETIYAIGGRGVNFESLKSVEIYSTSKGWKSINSMIEPRYDAGAVALSGKLYVIGGEGHSHTSKSVECYDPATDRWARCANLNESHFCPSVTVHKGQIYVIGGYSSYHSNEWGTFKNYSSAVERYDPQRNEWTKICSLNSARDGIGCISFENQLWVVGGTNSSKQDSVYDDEKDAWIDKTPIFLSGSYYCFIAPKSLFQSECKN